MTTFKDFAQIIGSWPRDGDRTSIGTFAADVGVPYLNAQMMKHRNSISPDYWPAIVEAAQTRGLGSVVTLEVLAQMKGRKRKRIRRPRQRASARALAA